MLRTFTGSLRVSRAINHGCPATVILRLDAVSEVFHDRSSMSASRTATQTDDCQRSFAAPRTAEHTSIEPAEVSS